ncbi:MAG: hypothetical protein ACFNNB_00025 [Candidatus Saccharimonas sp.]
MKHLTNYLINYLNLTTTGVAGAILVVFGIIPSILCQNVTAMTVVLYYLAMFLAIMWLDNFMESEGF